MYLAKNKMETHIEKHQSVDLFASGCSQYNCILDNKDNMTLKTVQIQHFAVQ